MKPRQSSLALRWRYRFDNLMAAGTIAVIASLAVATFLLIALAALVLALAGIEINGQTPTFLEAFWVSLLRTLDPGTMGGDTGWTFRLIALGVTLGGIFIVSVLIGVLTTGIGSKIEELRKGRTFVAEKGHTLILGWSPKLFSTVSELVLANQNQARSCVVIMAPQDKVGMEDEIRKRVGKPGRTRIVCRTGEPSNPKDLEIVNPLESKSVIVLSSEEEAPDAQVIKTILALLNRDPKLERLTIVAEFVDPGNARSIRSITKGGVLTVISNDVIGRITAQVCRQSGLSAVYQDLLDFSGSEIYFRTEPNTLGKTFREVMQASEKACVVGIRHSDGEVDLMPDLSSRVEEGDALIVIAEDDEALVFAPADGNGQVSLAVNRADAESERESILVIGWSHLGPLILNNLDHRVAKGSRLHVFYDRDFVSPDDLRLLPEFSNLKVSSTEADANDPARLTDLLTREAYDHIVLLCYRTGLTPKESDARTLMTLLQLRQLLEKIAAGRQISIVTELLEVEDVELARVASVDDFIVSERLTSLVIAQLAENPELDKVLAQLLESAGDVEIGLRPIGRYSDLVEPLTFGSLVAAAASFSESAIGYRVLSGDGEARIVLNPPKSDQVSLSPGDQVVVFAADGA